MAKSLVINCQTGGQELVDIPDEVKEVSPEMGQAFSIVDGAVVFLSPVTAPDFIVASRDIKTDPAQALAEAIAEATKPHGTAKSLDLIARSLAVVVEDMEKRLKKAKI